MSDSESDEQAVSNSGLSEVKNSPVTPTELIDSSGRLAIQGNIRDGAFSINSGPYGRILLTISSELMRRINGGREAISRQFFPEVYDDSFPAWGLEGADGSYTVEITVRSAISANGKLNQFLDLIEKRAGTIDSQLETSSRSDLFIKPIETSSRWQLFLRFLGIRD